MSTYVYERAKRLGLKIEDAKKPLISVVNEKDVARAKGKDPERCALARAVEREHEGVRQAYFFRSTAWLEYGDRMVRYLLTKPAMEEIKAFDRTKKFRPGNYVLKVPNDSNTLGAAKRRSRKQRKDGRTQRGHSKINRGVVHHVQDVRKAFQP